MARQWLTPSGGLIYESGSRQWNAAGAQISEAVAPDPVLGALTSRATATGTTGSITTGSFTVPAGDLILVGAGHRTASGNPSLQSISDSVGLTWTLIDSKTMTSGTNNPRTSVWAAISTGVAMTVTVAPVGSVSHGRVAVSSVANAAGDYSNFADHSNENGDPSATLPTAPGNHNLVVGWAMIQGAAAISPPSGFTELDEVGGGTHDFEVAYDDSDASATMTWSTSGFEATAVVVEFKPRSVGAAAGVGQATAPGLPAAVGDGGATGTGTATGAGTSLVLAVGAAAGTSTALAAGEGLATATGAAAGSGTTSGPSSVLKRGTGAAAGTSAALGVGAKITTATGAAAGSGAAAAVGGYGPSTGAAPGTGAATGVSTVTATATGAASATSAVDGSGRYAASATGEAAASSDAAAVAEPYATGVALSEGFGVAVGEGQSIALASGNAAGTANVVGRSTVIVVVTTPSNRIGYPGGGSRTGEVLNGGRIAYPKRTAA